jgi:stearoyl-CoA desaturase (delta-9 desaturase)
MGSATHHRSGCCGHLLFQVGGGFGITLLYHRAWTHGAVELKRPVEYGFAYLSTFMLQMPAKQWISAHIKHHGHTDTDDDPYNIERGFWWAHYEWIIFSPQPPIWLPPRLEANPVVSWQERYYWPLFAFNNGAVPVAIAWACGAPWWGGLLLSALRLVLTSHVIYSVNSICHKWGTQKFTRSVSARDVWWFPFALGEQYHNYHHAFPTDYRHGVGKLDFDPTKWMIWVLSSLGLASQLRAMPENRIKHATDRVRSGPVL